MSAAVHITGDGDTFVLAVDSHPEQMYVTVGMSRDDLEQLVAEIRRCLVAPALTVVGKEPS